MRRRAVCSAVSYAVYSISTRILARTDSNETTLFYSNLVGALAMTPAVWFVWTTPEEPLIIALMVAKHILVAILVMGLGVDAQRS